MRVNFSSRFEHSFRNLSISLQDKAHERIELFAECPQHPSLKLHKLKGGLEGFHAFSIDYRTRVIIKIDAGIAWAYDIGDHSIYE